jgi:hypothetical protein
MALQYGSCKKSWILCIRLNSSTRNSTTPRLLLIKDMTRYTSLLLVILLAVPQSASSQCIDSSIVAASNYYLIKGAEARENLALCIEFRKVDSAVIAEQDKIQTKLLDELQKRDDKIHKLKRICVSLAIGLIFFIFV